MGHGMPAWYGLLGPMMSGEEMGHFSRALAGWVLRWTAAVAGIPPDRAVGRALRMPLRPLRRTTLPVLQGPLRGCWWAVAAAPYSFWLGVWEHEKMRGFASRIVEGDVVYDIGAHVGLYTLLAARRAGCTGRVIAFEPHPGNLRHLVRHIQVNHIENVTVIPAAVSDRDGRARFVEGQTTATGHLGVGGGLEVDVVSLDQLRRSGQIPPPRVIKIDVEGGEHEVLIGAREVLGTGPAIFLATHGRAVHARCCRRLDLLGYVVTPLDADNLGEASELLAEPASRRPNPAARGGGT